MQSINADISCHLSRASDWAKKEYIEKAPGKWVSVDLRDGNQALIIPMSLEQKLEYFKKLAEIGFKEIEIGFPAASETEFELARTLIRERHDSRRRHHPGAHPGTRAHYQEDIRRPRGLQDSRHHSRIQLQ